MNAKRFCIKLLRAVKYSQLGRWIYENNQLVIFELTPEDYIATAEVKGAEVNSRKAIARFSPSESWHNKEQMVDLFNCRLDDGEVVVTMEVRGRLACYAWLNPCQRSGYFPSVRQTYQFPDDCTALYNVYTHPDHRGQGLYKQVLNCAVSWCFGRDREARLLTAIEAGNSVALKVNQQMGFRKVAILSFRNCLGRTTKNQVRL